MSARRVLSDFEERIAVVADADVGIRLLHEFAEALARSNAEMVFLKVVGDPGWSGPARQELADRVVGESLSIITDTVHGFGGDLAMAEDLGRAHAEAYGRRLRELSAGVAFTAGASP